MTKRKPMSIEEIKINKPAKCIKQNVVKPNHNIIKNRENIIGIIIELKII